MSERVPSSAIGTDLARAPFLQRACATCSAEAAASERERFGIQAKLTVNAPGDRWEQEADRIADAVVADRPVPLRGPLALTPAVQRQEGEEEEEEEEEALQAKADTVQRQVEEEEEEEEMLQAKGSGDARSTPNSTPTPGPAFAAALAGESQGGQALDSATRAAFEPRLGRDLSAVRLHAGPQAAHLSRQINARAFTHRNHIFFASGQLDTQTRDGRHLLAHEIAHTVQQGESDSALAPQLQRRNIFEEFAGLFKGDSFDDEELRAYLRKITGDSKIEDYTDSDNKARALVNRLRNGDDWFGFKDTGNLRALLIREMQSGVTGPDDEHAIQFLLDGADDGQLQAMFTTGGLTVKGLESDIQGGERQTLRHFFENRFKGGRKALLEGKVKAQPKRTDFANMVVERAMRELAIVEKKLEAAYAIKYDRESSLNDRRALDATASSPDTVLGDRAAQERDRAEKMNKLPLEIQVGDKTVVFRVKFQARFEDPAMKGRATELERHLRDGIADVWDQKLGGSFGGMDFRLEPEIVFVSEIAPRDHRYWLVTVRKDDLGPINYPGCKLEGVKGVPTSVTDPLCDGGVMSLPPKHIVKTDILGHETLHLFGLVDRYLAITSQDAKGNVTGHENAKDRQTPYADPLGAEKGKILDEDLAFVFDTQGVYDRYSDLYTGGDSIVRLEKRLEELKEIIRLGYDPYSLVQPRRDFNDKQDQMTDDL